MGTKQFKVQMRVSVQLQRALNNTRRWIRVLSRTLRVMTRKKDLFILMNEFEQESHKHSSQKRARRGFVLIKLKLFYIFFKWPIVSLDNTLIHHLVSFKALLSCIETFIWTLNCLVPNEVHYMENILECFHQKP